MREFNALHLETAQTAQQAEERTAETNFSRALFTILIADVSMSFDNIVAVAAKARDNIQMLVFGLALAIAMMVLLALVIMRIMLRYKMLSYLGLLLLIYLTVMMLHDGATDLGIFDAFDFM